MSPRPRQRQMLIDVSILVQGNEQVGVGSVLRAIVTQWLQAPLLGWQVVPVYSRPAATAVTVRPAALPVLCLTCQRTGRSMSLLKPIPVTFFSALVLKWRNSPCWRGGIGGGCVSSSFCLIACDQILMRNFIVVGKTNCAVLMVLFVFRALLLANGRIGNK